MKRIIFISSVIFSLLSCNSDKPKKAGSSITKVVLPQPFRYHKSVEVRPGLTFDVLSWGRGAEHFGQYLILRSDSSHSKYNAISEELNGDIVDVWNMDLDSDGNPELFIQSKGKDIESNLNLYVHEFSDDGTSQEIKFPALTSRTLKKYHGKDSLYIKDGGLFRDFPLYDEKDTGGIKPIDTMRIEYLLKGNKFDLKELTDKR